MSQYQRVEMAVALSFGLAFAVNGWREIAAEIVGALW
jgi:hypothetical protein